MTWRYVAARKLHDTGVEWTVREYYDDIAGRGEAWTVDAMSASGETSLELRQNLGQMLSDLIDATHFINLDADPPALRPMSEA